MALTLAIVGRPNVGKSTLFNRLAGRRVALVDDTPGLTRDRREAEGQLGDLAFRLIDTAGFEDAEPSTLSGRMLAQTAKALAAADIALFLIDARAGVAPLDRHFARWLRKSGRPVILVANKSEGARSQPGAIEAHELGFGEPIAISAEHGEGLADLHRALLPLVARMSAPPTTEPNSADAAALRLAVIGRPNVGKSTLVNRLIGEERLLTGPEPGITRDAIEINWRWRGRDLRLVDTAGLRRKSRIGDRLEKLSTADTLRAVRRAEVVALVIDATMMLEKQDLTIASLVVEEGRALVIAVNKWDLVEDRAAALKRLRDRLEISLPQVKGIAFVTLSALTGRGLDELMRAVFDAHALWNTKLPTARLNRWLEGVSEAHPPPLARGRRPRLRYIVQTRSRPPSFTLFGVRPDALAEDYLRYLANSLRERFHLPGVPLRFALRAGKNPYVDAKE